MIHGKVGPYLRVLLVQFSFTELLKVVTVTPMHRIPVSIAVSLPLLAGNWYFWKELEMQSCRNFGMRILAFGGIIINYYYVMLSREGFFQRLQSRGSCCINASVGIRTEVRVSDA